MAVWREGRECDCLWQWVRDRNVIVYGSEMRDRNVLSACGVIRNTQMTKETLIVSIAGNVRPLMSIKMKQQHLTRK